MNMYLPNGTGYVDVLANNEFMPGRGCVSLALRDDRAEQQFVWGKGIDLFHPYFLKIDYDLYDQVCNT